MEWKQCVMHHAQALFTLSVRVDHKRSFMKDVFDVEMSAITGSCSLSYYPILLLLQFLQVMTDACTATPADVTTDYTQ